MMEFFSQIFNLLLGQRSGGQSGKIITSPVMIAKIFEHIKNTNTHVIAHFPNRYGKFQTIVVKVISNRKKVEVWLDELQPSSGNTYILEEGKMFDLQSKFRGVEVKCDLKDIKEFNVSKEESGILYRLVVQRVHYNQRRAFHRVNISSTKTPVVLFTAVPEVRVFRGEVADVSARGCGMQVIEMDGEPPKVGDAFETCRFTLPGLGEIKAKATIRSVRTDKVSYRPRLGLMFPDIDHHTQERLAKFILQTQRQQVQKKNKMQEFYQGS